GRARAGTVRGAVGAGAVARSLSSLSSSLPSSLAVAAPGPPASELSEGGRRHKAAGPPRHERTGSADSESGDLVPRTRSPPGGPRWPVWAAWPFPLQGRGGRTGAPDWPRETRIGPDEPQQGPLPS